MSKYESGLDLIRSEWAPSNEAGRQGILFELRRKEWAIIDVIKALREAGVFTLGEAKQYVSASPAWDDVAERARPLQEEAIRVLKEFT